MPWGWFKKPIDDLNDIAKIRVQPNVKIRDISVADAAFYKEERTPIISIKNGVVFDENDRLVESKNIKTMLSTNGIYVRLIEIDGSPPVVDFVRIIKTDLSYYMAIEVCVGKGEGPFHKIVPVCFASFRSGFRLTFLWFFLR